MQKDQNRKNRRFSESKFQLLKYQNGYKWKAFIIYRQWLQKFNQQPILPRQNPTARCQASPTISKRFHSITKNYSFWSSLKQQIKI